MFKSLRKNLKILGIKTTPCLTPISDLKGCVNLLSSLTDRTGKLVQDIFHIDNQVIECATSYKYIGIMLQASEKFNQARKMMYNKALKGMFKIRKDLSNLNPYINTLL
jgi:hypothetical protein